MSEIWNEKVLPLKDDSTSALLDITRVGTGEVGSDNKLFKMFERAWKSRQVSAVLVTNGADAYYHFWHKPIEDLYYEHLTDSPGKRSLRGLRTLKRRDISPLIIALADTYGMKAIFDTKLLRLIEAYQLWMAIIGKRGRERDFTALAYEINKNTIQKDEAITKLAELIKRLAPPIEEVKTAIKNSAYRGRIMMFIVRSYEEGMRGDVQIDDVQYEHIMPKTPTDYWYEVAWQTVTFRVGECIKVM